MAKAKLKVILPEKADEELRQNLRDVFKEKDDSVRFWIRAKPGASKEFLQFKDDQLVLSLRAQPIDGQANSAVLATISSLMNIAKSKIRISVGEKSRDKELQLEGVGVEHCISQLINKA